MNRSRLHVLLLLTFAAILAWSARHPKDGFIWFAGRADDVIKTAGERVGPFEVESALVSYPAVAEAAAVGRPDELKGHALVVFVSLKSTHTASEELKEALRAHVGKEIGSLAKPDQVRFAAALPKTRSGKIMRRILRKIAEDDFGALGDTSTLADPAVVEDLVANRQNRRG